MPGTLEGGSITSRVARELRRRIIVGELRPGEKLKVEVLREVLDSGASPIREALSLLTSDHLVERSDQRGFRVASASAEHFQEILKTRCWIEDLALRETIANRTADWEEQLVLSHHRLSRAERETSNDPDHPGGWEALHKAFHMTLISGCGSSMLQRFCSQLYDLNVRYRYLAVRSSDYASRDVAAEHREILDAAINADADRAVAALVSHYRKTGTFLVDSI